MRRVEKKRNNKGREFLGRRRNRNSRADADICVLQVAYVDYHINVTYIP